MKLHLVIAAILSTTIDGGGITVVDPQQVVVSDSSQGDDPCPLCPEGEVLSNPDFVFDNESMMTCLDAYSQVQESTTLSSLEDSDACTLAKDGFAESGCLCAPEGAKVDDPLLRGGSNAHHVGVANGLRKQDLGQGCSVFKKCDDTTSYGRKIDCDVLFKCRLKNEEPCDADSDCKTGSLCLTYQCDDCGGDYWAGHCDDLFDDGLYSGSEAVCLKKATTDTNKHYEKWSGYGTGSTNDDDEADAELCPAN